MGADPCSIESCRLGIPGNADNRARAGSTVDGSWIALTTKLQLSLFKRQCVLAKQASCCCYYETGKPQLQKHQPWPQITPCSVQVRNHPCAVSGASTYHSRAPKTVAARRELQGLKWQDSKYDGDTATASAINPANQKIMVTPSMATMISRCARLGAYIGARIR